MTTIVIPARNEGAVIGGLLGALTNNNTEDFDIVVVCNGCTDNTADIARSFGSRVRVLETPVGNKSNALNLGDQAALGFPRIYIDADVLVKADAVAAVSKALQNGEALAAGVAPTIDTTGCSTAVKAYYRVQRKLPSAREGIGGSGIYALSEEGRERFGIFPAIVSDDLFVRLNFKETERKILQRYHTIVFAPRAIKSLLITRTRSNFGNMQLSTLYPELFKNNTQRNTKTLVSLFMNPSLWFPLTIYFYVVIRSRLKAKRQLRDSSFVWVLERTSRETRRGAKP